MPQHLPHPATERENLAGLVERVTFHNVDSGFCVLRIKARGQRDLVTIVGHAGAIGAGEFVQARHRARHVEAPAQWHFRHTAP